MERGDRRTVDGIVTSDKMNKTIAVKVERLFKHPKFEKYIRRYTTLKAHDEKEEGSVGDRVRLMECRPISKTKCWRLIEVLEKSKDNG